MDDDPSTPTSPTRPGSRALSEASFATATERAHSPHSPRALAHEIEHIKNLISRAQHKPAASGSITAQVFQRNRSGSHEPVSQARIFHELDVLKRRVRHVRGGSDGLPVLQRRPSEVDPGAETESEGGDNDAVSLDEREEELEWARGELDRVKQEREEWLEDAERRVDVLIAEKESLVQRVGEGRKETEWVRSNLEEAQGRIKELREEMQEVRRILEEEKKEKEDISASYKQARDQVETLRAEKNEMNQKLEDLQSSLQDVRSQVESLQTERDTSARSLDEATCKISALEENSRVSGEHVQRLISEHKTQNAESESRRKDLQERHDRVQKEGRLAAGKVKELEKAAQDDELGRADLMRELEEQRKLLASAREEVEGYGKEVEKLVKQHDVSKKVVESLRAERDEQKVSSEGFAKERDHLKASLEALTSERDEGRKALGQARSDAAEASSAADEKHAALQKELDAIRISLESLTQERDNHKHDLDRAKDEKSELSRAAEEKQTALRDENAKQQATLQGDIDDLQAKHAAELADLKAERDRFATDADSAQQQALQDVEKKHETLKQEHGQMLVELKVAHEDETRRLREEAQKTADKKAAKSNEDLEALRLELNDAKESHGRELAALRDQHETAQKESEDQKASELQDRDSLHRQALETVQHELASAKVAHQDEVDALREQHDSQSRDLQQSHDESNTEQSSTHQKALESAKAELAEAKQKHDETLDELKRSHASALEEQRSQYQRSLDDALAQLAAAGSSHQQTVEGLEKQHQDTVASLRQDLSETQEASKSAGQNAESDRLQQQAALEEAQTQLSQAKESHEKALSEMGSTHESAVSSLKAELLQGQEALAEVKKSSGEDADRLRGEHDKTLADTRERHEADLATLRDELAAARTIMQTNSATSAADMDRLRSEHKSTIEELKSAHESEIAVLRLENQGAEGKVRAGHEETVARLQRETDEAMARAEAAFESKMSDMQIRHEDALVKAQTDHKAALDGLRGEHEAATSRAAQNHDSQVSSLTSMGEELRKTMAQLKSEHVIALKEMSVEKERMAADHGMSLSDVEARLHQSHADHQAEIARVQEDHVRELEALRNDPSIAQQEGELESLCAQLEKLKAEQKMVLSEKDAELGSQISALRYEHSKALSDVQGQHQNALQEQRNAFETEIAALRHSHEEALAEAKSEGRRETEDRITRLEEQHEASLRAALAHADDDLDERLRSQAQAHGAEIEQIHESLNDELAHLQTQLEAASELRHTQMTAADAQNRGALAELGDKLATAERASAELASKHVTVMAELTALQARLDAESTGHAEAERALAHMRKQRFEEERKGSDSGDELLRQIAELQVERDALQKQVDGGDVAADAAARDAPTGDRADASAEHGDGEVARLKSRIADLQLDAQRQADEFARQNEFLVKELESMRMHAVTPIASPAPQSDAFAQTSPEKVVQRRERGVLQPAAHKQVNGGAERPSTAGSFEDYLEQAKAELSELGSVITANEALFAQKIQEHVGSLQFAKDQLAAEYKDKFEALLVDKERMDKDVHSRSAEEFARDRQQLAATYGADEAGAAALSSPQKQAFRSAEERLVRDYNRRIAKKKSKIALKHAEDFQNLTKDYDIQIAELLSSKERLEGDLSVDPSKFETDYDEMDARSLQLEVQKNNDRRSADMSRNNATAAGDRNVSRSSREEAVSPQPPPEILSTPTAEAKAERRRSALPRLSSTPRTPTSIPRAVPFPGNRDSPDATSQPLTPRRPYEPVAQRSLMRAKFPVEGHGEARRSATNPALTTPSAGAARTSPGVEAADPGKARKRQLRHSSGMHFANWKEQQY